jgi:transcriptional regulator with XRE-family HTH domain
MATDPDSRSLGEVIRAARVAARLSLRALARRLAITPSYQSDIENDRRVPAEDVLRATAAALKIDFDDLMARAGRFGEQAGRYLRRHPTAGALFRKIAESNLSEEALKKLLGSAEELGRKKPKEEGP